MSTLTLLTPALGSDLVISSSGQRPSLIELFSSEGCSSCPPAEAWFTHLKSDPHLWQTFVPISFHVDYWDNLFWSDPYARKQYTERQRRYAAHWGGDTVYTPGFALNGKEWRGWGGETGQLPAEKGAGQLKLLVQDQKVTTFYQGQAGDGLVTLNIAWLGIGLSSNVRGGENSGRTLTHDFIALDLQQQPLKLSAAGEGKSEVLTPHLTTSDTPAAMAAWITGPDGSLQQVVGGWLK